MWYIIHIHYSSIWILLRFGYAHILFMLAFSSFIIGQSNFIRKQKENMYTYTLIHIFILPYSHYYCSTQICVSDIFYSYKYWLQLYVARFASHFQTVIITAVVFLIMMHNSNIHSNGKYINRGLTCMTSKKRKCKQCRYWTTFIIDFL